MCRILSLVLLVVLLSGSAYVAGGYWPITPRHGKPEPPPGEQRLANSDRQIAESKRELKEVNDRIAEIQPKLEAANANKGKAEDGMDDLVAAGLKAKLRSLRANQKELQAKLQAQQRQQDQELDDLVADTARIVDRYRQAPPAEKKPDPANSPRPDPAAAAAVVRELLAKLAAGAPPTEMEGHFAGPIRSEVAGALAEFRQKWKGKPREMTNRHASRVRLVTMASAVVAVVEDDKGRRVTTLTHRDGRWVCDSWAWLVTLEP